MITITTLKKLFLVSLGIILIVSLGFWIWLPANGLNAANKFIPWKFKLLWLGSQSKLRNLY